MSKTMMVPSKDEQVVEIPTDCAACGVAGSTRMAVTYIPTFKNVIMSVFRCDACNHVVSDMKMMAGTSPMGRAISLTLTSLRDLSRDLYTSDFTIIEIPELGLELQGGPTKNRFVTISQLIDAIEHDLRTQSNLIGVPENDIDDRSKQLEHFLASLLELKREASLPWTLKLRDIEGNSYISALPTGPEESNDPHKRVKTDISDKLESTDTHLITTEFTRSKAENELVGIIDQ